LKHCLLENRDGAWFVTDLVSSNGIRIDGTRCRDGQLSHGSVLSIAEYHFEVVRLSRRPSTADVSAPVHDAGHDAGHDPVHEPQELSSENSQVPSTQVPENVAARSIRPTLPPQTAPPLGNLIPLEGGAAIPLRDSSLLIGRSPACNIVLPYREISGKHCQLEILDGVWRVRDLGSRNGIQVDGKPETAAVLKPNAILSIAKHRFKIVYQPQVSDMECVDAPLATLDLAEVEPPDRVTFADVPEAVLAAEVAANSPQNV
jgi:pSer/pThr/pTyr-binding forkhead associated (FHA) protein